MQTSQAPVFQSSPPARDAANRRPGAGVVAPNAPQARHAASVSVRTIVVRWLLGAVISSVLVALIAPCFLSSLRVYEWSSELDDYVMKDGYVHRKRDEGWASTHYGPYGFNRGVGPLDTNAANVMVWGDSFVEAHQVSDRQKAIYLINRVLARSGPSGLRAVAVGRACWSVSDYYFKIPHYEKLLNPVCHFLIVAEGGLKDLCPDGTTFIAASSPRLVRRNLVNAQKSKIITDLHRWGLSDVLLAPWEAVRTLTSDCRRLCFSLGPHEQVGQPMARCGCDAPLALADPNAIVAGWDYVLDMLKTATGKPIVLVLVPEVPHLERGVVSCDDPQAPWRARLLELCRIKDIGCIDLADALVDDYRQTGKLSRGFHNGQPGSGHLNGRGHRLLAREICTYLNEHTKSLRRTGYAVHPN